MHFSCKITHAILNFLERHGEDLSALYDPVFPPTEILRDPSSWMSAPEMESFLESLMRMRWSCTDGNLLVVAGHAGPGNHAWGVLDSVLRMMPRPQEIFHQPERFLSHFISPEPPIENLRRDEISLSFDLPLPAEQYPLVTCYLKAAFESLPIYVGQGLAKCEWQDITLKITWPEKQDTLFAKEQGHQISPDLLQSVINDQHRLLQELEGKNRELLRANEELSQLRAESEGEIRPVPLMTAAGAEAALQALATESQNRYSPEHVIVQNLARLHDYMVRAQQLVTLLSGLARREKESAIREALRRTDWDYVKAQYPRAISESVESLRRMQTRPSLPKEEQPYV